jgi:ubiquinone biosynthesis UbiH/UbiF/VisC/COQ6 family hydroxylase
MQDFDLIIAGGGLVGLSLAGALRGSGLRIAVIERGRPANLSPLPDDPTWDSRVYAISPSSEAFLSGVGAWPAQRERIAPVYEMRVFGDEQTGAMRFTAYEAHVAHLACIVEGRLLIERLWTALADRPEVTVFSGAGTAAVTWHADGATLTLTDGRELRGRLLVAADGGDSWLRSQAGIEAKVRPYGQTAVVANFACQQDHRGTAFQWFRDDGVLALLPLPGQRTSMVWSARTELAEELVGLAPAALGERVTQASLEALGKLDVITAQAAFPLRLIRVARLVQPRLALVGDAAHNLHPLAGQGVNLGFQDASTLAQVLRERGSCADVGELRLLRRYERARQEDILAMTLVTDGLQRLFDARGRALKELRNWGMTLVDRSSPLKHYLIRHALG